MAVNRSCFCSHKKFPPLEQKGYQYTWNYSVHKENTTMDYDFHKAVLSDNRHYLEDNLNVRDVMDSFISRSVITERQKQTVEAESENFMKVRKVVDILQTLPVQNFVLFCEACVDGGYPHIKEKLMSAFPMSPTGLMPDPGFNFKNQHKT